MLSRKHISQILRLSVYLNVCLSAIMPISSNDANSIKTPILLVYTQGAGIDTYHELRQRKDEQMDRQDNIPIPNKNRVDPLAKNLPRSAPGHPSVDQLQVIRIPPEIRAKLAEIRRERDRHDSQTWGRASAMIALAMLALLFLAGTLLAFVTGLGATLLRVLPLTARPAALILVGVGVIFSLLWVIYTLLQVYQDAEDYRERQV